MSLWLINVGIMLIALINVDPLVFQFDSTNPFQRLYFHVTEQCNHETNSPYPYLNWTNLAHQERIILYQWSFIWPILYFLLLQTILYFFPTILLHASHDFSDYFAYADTCETGRQVYQQVAFQLFSVHWVYTTIFQKLNERVIRHLFAKSTSDEDWTYGNFSAVT